MTQRYFGRRNKFLVTTVSDSDAEACVQAGFQEFPSESPSPIHRFVDGAWVDNQVTRHYVKDGRFATSAHLAPDLHDDLRAQGYEECSSQPPGPAQLYVWDGATWQVDLPAYRQAAIQNLKNVAVGKARQAFNSAPYEALYHRVTAEINASSDSADIDAKLAGVVWPE